MSSTCASKAVMRAIQVKKFGGSEVLQLAANVCKPSVKENEVLVQLKSSGVNPVDTYVRDGAFAALPELPYIPGKDGAGVVEDVGVDVKNFKVGDRVFLTKNGRHGSLAEYIAVEHNNVFPLHQRLSFAEGAAVPIPYFTAYRALYIKGCARPGYRVLVHGASGGVGQAAVQLAAGSAMVVVGTAGTPQGEQVVRDCGAAAVYNHRDKDYMDKLSSNETEKFDVILEMLSNVNLGADLSLLRPRGIVVIIGCRGEVTINPRLLMQTESSIVGCALFTSTKEEWAETGRGVVQAIETGTVRPRVSKHYSLEQAAQAHDDIMSGKPTLGKLVVDVTL